MKYLATDLDGTLFYPKDKKEMITKENLLLVREFIDKGNELIVISGRSLMYCVQVLRRINRDVTLICYNGSVIYSNNKCLIDYSINNDIAKKIIHECYDELKIKGILLMTDKGLYVKTRTELEFFKVFYKKIYGLQKVYAENVIIDNNEFAKELESGKIYKIMFYFGLTRKAKIKAREYNKILRNNYEQFESSWSDTVIELTNKNCNKGNALDTYFNEKNVNKEDIFVVGDSGNDISMFNKYYENSFCIEHRNKPVQKYAKNVIKNFVDLKNYIFK